MFMKRGQIPRQQGNVGTEQELSAFNLYALQIRLKILNPQLQIKQWDKYKVKQGFKCGNQMELQESIGPPIMSFCHTVDDMPQELNSFYINQPMIKLVLSQFKVTKPIDDIEDLTVNTSPDYNLENTAP